MLERYRVTFRAVQLDGPSNTLTSSQIVFSESPSTILDALNIVLNNFPQSNDSAAKINKAAKK